MAQRTREEIKTLKEAVIKYHEEHPEMKTKEICAHFNIKPFFYYYLTRKSAGRGARKAKAVKREEAEKPAVEFSNIPAAPTFLNLVARINEVAKFAQEVLTAQQERAKQLFL